ncbi:solute carrier family 23 member 1 [Elysia marginata]|uniref:Solute carrier family 23 member 1 n=1 Tax=Elysia marginata TaxID=1093978 RepID=A0AAV4IND2_9GAST|nr:solute carrier family 23 member 1 [Elysia marginata]
MDEKFPAMAVNYNSITHDTSATLIQGTELEEGEEEERREEEEEVDVFYTLEETPPWHLCLFLAFQQALITFQSVFAYPLVVKDALCVTGDDVGLVQVISTTCFIVGLSTLLQCTFGVRLPIIQCTSAAFITPTLVLLQLKDSNCPYNHQEFSNSTSLPEKGSHGHKEIWHRNMREVQGSLMVAAALYLLIGFSGIIGTLLKYIGPLTVAPILLLVAISLLDISTQMASSHWYICFMTIFLVVLFSQYLQGFSMAVPGLREKIKIFDLFSLLLAMITAWIICLILTKAGVFTNNPTSWGYKARTDSRTSILKEAHWIDFPYPGQFGMPTVSLAGVISYLAVFLSSGVESVGTYYPTAKVSDAPPPSFSAVSRGIFLEGICGILAGAWGCPAGTVAYCQNVANMVISKAASRSVTQVAGILLIVMGCAGKFGALFSTIPDPVIGGILFSIFGMIGSVGVANLKHVDMDSARNVFIFGLSIYVGLGLPQWVRENRSSIKTGNDDLDNVVVVLGGTSMFVGGFLAFILDNTIPGTLEERGMISWKKEEEYGEQDLSTYDLPWIQTWLDRFPFLRYVPICPRSFLDKKAPKRKSPQTLEQNWLTEDGGENGLSPH